MKWTAPTLKMTLGKVVLKIETTYCGSGNKSDGTATVCVLDTLDGTPEDNAKEWPKTALARLAMAISEAQAELDGGV